MERDTTTSISRGSDGALPTASRISCGVRCSPATRSRRLLFLVSAIGAQVMLLKGG
jgi:hypothetical protein